VILWGGGFAAATLSSVAGAAYHAWRIPWKLVPMATGAAALCFGTAAAVAWLGPRARRIAIAILAVEFAACVVAALMTESFVVVAADYLPVLLAILVGCVTHWRDRAARLIAIGIVVSFVAAGVQMSALPAHNDVYHVIQMAAMYLLYRGYAAFTRT